MHSHSRLPCGAAERKGLGQGQRDIRTTGVAPGQEGVDSQPGCKVPVLGVGLSLEGAESSCRLDNTGDHQLAEALLQVWPDRAMEFCTGCHMAHGVHPHRILADNRQLGIPCFLPQITKAYPAYLCPYPLSCVRFSVKACGPHTQLPWRLKQLRQFRGNGCDACRDGFDACGGCLHRNQTSRYCIERPGCGCDCD